MRIRVFAAGRARIHRRITPELSDSSHRDDVELTARGQGGVGRDHCRPRLPEHVRRGDAGARVLRHDLGREDRTVVELDAAAGIDDLDVRAPLLFGEAAAR